MFGYPGYSPLATYNHGKLFMTMGTNHLAFFPDHPKKECPSAWFANESASSQLSTVQVPVIQSQVFPATFVPMTDGAMFFRQGPSPQIDAH